MRFRFAIACLTALEVLCCAAPSVALADEPRPVVDDESRERSRAAFRRGVLQLRAQDWMSARASFEEAWSLYPHTSILLNLGMARLNTGDPVRAEQDFVRFLSEDVGASPEELAGAHEALAEARSRVGTLKVVVAPTSARVSVDGKAVDAVRRRGGSGGGEEVVAEVRTLPGKHRVTVEAEGFVTAVRQLEVSAKAETAERVTLSPAVPTPLASKTVGPSTRAMVGWSLAGLSGVALVGSGVMALRAMSLADDYAEPTSPGFQQEGTRSEGVAFRTTADVLLGVGVAAGAAAVVLLVFDGARGRGRVAVSGRGGPPRGMAPAFGAPVVRW